MTLSAAKVRSLNIPGRYADGRGLYLQIDRPREGLEHSAKRRSWLFRYMVNRRARAMGLGPFPEVSLAEAREKAFEARRLVLRGIDPIDNRPRPSGETFQSCA